MNTKVEIRDKKLRQRLAAIKDNSEKPSRLWRRIHAHQQQQSQLMFIRLSHGGTFRGVTWPWYADQYTRSTDGVTVPAEGGVPNIGQYSWISQRRREKLKAQGTITRTDKRRVVQGRKRPSGTRVTATSNLLRDTRHMSKATAVGLRVTGGGNTAELITPVSYARYQQDMRPFSFFTREDARLYRTWAAEDVLKK